MKKTEAVENIIPTSRHKKPARPEEKWEAPLRICLEQRFKRLDKRGQVNAERKKLVSRRAIKEIIAGVKFCQNQTPSISVIKTTLSRTFDIEDECGCLLAKGLRMEFPDALDQLGLNTNKACRIGCAYSGDYFYCMSSWSECYNPLWRATGRFFKKHPEFGIT